MSNYGYLTDYLSFMEIDIVSLNKLAEGAKFFLQKVVTPPLEEIGLLFADEVKYWRFRNQVKTLLKAEALLEAKGLRTRKVALKVLTPMLEGASLEEDQSLQDKWAALMANTISEESTINTNLYAHILSELTKAEADLFTAIVTHCSRGSSLEPPNFRAVHTKPLREVHEYADLMIDNLLRLRLVRELPTHGEHSQFITLTPLGSGFYQACKA